MLGGVDIHVIDGRRGGMYVIDIDVMGEVW